LLPRNPYSTSLAWGCSRLHLSIRFGSKARPAARASDLKHLVFGDYTRSRGTPAGCYCRQPAETLHPQSLHRDFHSGAAPRRLWKSPPSNPTARLTIRRLHSNPDQPRVPILASSRRSVVVAMLRHGRPLLYGQTENQAELSSPSASAAGSGSPASRCVYEYAIDQFIAWYCSEPRLAFNRIVVVRYRMYLETRGLAANTINQQLAACTAWLTKPPIQACSVPSWLRESAE